MQTGENTVDGAMGATIWWQWTAPSAGWVKFDTIGSEIDTVMRVSRTAGLAGTLFGFNDEAPDEIGASSLTFQVTAGQILYIAVGGYDFGFGPDEGAITFRITTGVSIRPPVWISSSTLSPTSVNVTSAAQTSVYSVTVDGSVGASGTIADLVLQRTSNSEFINLVASSTQGFVVGSQAASSTIQVPRFIQGGALRPVVSLETTNGDIFQWGSELSGAPYLFNMPTLTITNSGSVDTLPPVLSSFTISSRTANVNASAVTLNLAMTITDNLSGVSDVSVQIVHPDDTLNRPVAVSRISGTIGNGNWTGNLVIPYEFPTAQYEVIVELSDVAGNFIDYGGINGTRVMPGGDVTINVTGGGSYWLWAYEVIPNDNLVGMTLDPNGDGINNLTCFAFGLDPLSEILRSDLPQVEITESGLLEMTFYRRIGANGLIYQPQFSDDLHTWNDYVGTETLIDETTEWSLHSLLDSSASTGKMQRFARMKLSYTDP